MINIQRNPEIPKALNKASFEGVKAALMVMQSNKCYLCENKDAITTQIEHFISIAQGGPKYEWKNLLLACDHCNSIKNHIVDKKEGFDILDCTDYNVIISDEIKFLCDPHPKEKIKIELASKKEDNQSALNLVELLQGIYNYPSESLSFDAKALTDTVIKEMKKLLDLLHELEFESHSPEKRDFMILKIQDCLSIQAPFTAFKIWYIRDRYADTEFVDYLPKF